MVQQNAGRIAPHWYASTNLEVAFKFDQICSRLQRHNRTNLAVSQGKQLSEVGDQTENAQKSDEACKTLKGTCHHPESFN